MRNYILSTLSLIVYIIALFILYVISVMINSKTVTGTLIGLDLFLYYIPILYFSTLLYVFSKPPSLIVALMIVVTFLHLVLLVPIIMLPMIHLTFGQFFLLSAPYTLIFLRSMIRW